MRLDVEPETAPRHFTMSASSWLAAWRSGRNSRIAWGRVEGGEAAADGDEVGCARKDGEGEEYTTCGSAVAALLSLLVVATVPAFG